MKIPDKCPCSSGKLYAECCQIYHNGGNPPTAVALMRSRYSAYALGLSDYIIATTHPQNPQFNADASHWKNEIEAFSQDFTFERLDVRDHVELQEKAYVLFVAYLKHQGADAAFSEKSAFEKVDGRWLYLSGEVVSGSKAL